MNISSIGSLSSNLGAATQMAVQKPVPTPDQRALVAAARTVNAAQLFGQENEVTFMVDRAANIAVVRVVNKETGELVAQIPNEQLLKMAEKSSGS